MAVDVASLLDSGKRNAYAAAMRFIMDPNCPLRVSRKGAAGDDAKEAEEPLIGAGVIASLQSENLLERVSDSSGMLLLVLLNACREATGAVPITGLRLNRRPRMFFHMLENCNVILNEALVVLGGVRLSSVSAQDILNATQSPRLVLSVIRAIFDDAFLAKLVLDTAPNAAAATNDTEASADIDETAEENLLLWLRSRGCGVENFNIESWESGAELSTLLIPYTSLPTAGDNDDLFTAALDAAEDALGIPAAMLRFDSRADPDTLIWKPDEGLVMLYIGMVGKRINDLDEATATVKAARNR
jgi:hypothetical protein